MPEIVHDADLLEAGDDAQLVHLDSLGEMIRRHGQDPYRTRSVEVDVDVDDAALLRFTLYLHRDGQLYLDCDHETALEHTEACEVATETVEAALAGDLPSWWHAPALAGVGRQGGPDSAAPNGPAPS